jgi:uncharacterized SAM-binding protein YcdF (DUF218 family)
MLAVKTVLGALLMPLPIACLLASVGLVTKGVGHRRLGHVLVALGGFIALAATLGPVSNVLLRPLEDRYPAIIDPSVIRPLPRYIAVLGSGYRPRDGLPITAALDAVALVRLTEGVRLFRQMPGSRLILSGGAVDGQPPSARGYELAAMALGVPSSSIDIIDSPLDTGAEIRALHARLGNAPVILVTSAAHMPRAMAHCARGGLRAVAAPTGNLTEPSGTWGVGAFLPSGTSLRKTETAFHEYVGLLALTLGVT